MNSVAVVHLPGASGHFLGYAQCFVEAALSRYTSVYILVPEREPAESFAVLRDLGAKLVTYCAAFPAFFSATQGYHKTSVWFGVRRACADLARRLQQQIHLILTFIDMFPLAFAVFGVPKGVASVFALTMRADIGQHGGTGVRAWIKHVVWRNLARNFPGTLASNDPCLVEQLGVTARAQLLEDFSFCHNLSPLEPPQSQLTCLAIGYLDARKNLSPLLQAALICRRNGVPLNLLLAGELFEAQIDAAGREALAQLRAQSAIREWSGRLSQTQYREALSQAHIVWAVYRDHEFASGVVIDAMAAGRALLAQSSGVIGHYAKRYPLALTQSNDADPEQVAKSLEQLRELIIRSQSIRLQTAGSAKVSPGSTASTDLARPDRAPADRPQYIARLARALVGSG